YYRRLNSATLAVVEVPSLAPLANGELELLRRHQQLHRLQWGQYLRHQGPQRRHPQLVRLLHHPRQLLFVLLHRRLNHLASSTPFGHLRSPPCSVHRDGQQRLVRHVLLQRGHLGGQPVLFLQRPAVEVVDRGQLGCGETHQPSLEGGGQAAGGEDVVEVGLELVAGEGVEEADGEGGAAAAEPEEGVLEGGAPRRAEEGGPVLPRQRPPLLGVLLVVPHALLHQLPQPRVALPSLALHGLEQLVQVRLLLSDPLVEARTKPTVHP
uniref:Uncharacterized protein LOC114914260 n=1 Tax=Elaeis guineensis var. tenera TaxID=51953 RepID=A0A8N4F414_ELAGV